MAEAAVVMRDQFLSIAAHEIKTPLTTMLGYIQVLQYRMRRARITDERAARTLDVIGAQDQRLNRLIDPLMDVARINQGHLSLERAPLDLGALVVRVVSVVKEIVALHGGTVTVESTEGEGSTFTVSLPLL